MAGIPDRRKRDRDASPILGQRPDEIGQAGGLMPGNPRQDRADRGAGTPPAFASSRGRLPAAGRAGCVDPLRPRQLPRPRSHPRRGPRAGTGRGTGTRRQRWRWGPSSSRRALPDDPTPRIVRHARPALPILLTKRQLSIERDALHVGTRVAASASFERVIEATVLRRRRHLAREKTITTSRLALELVRYVVRIQGRRTRTGTVVRETDLPQRMDLGPSVLVELVTGYR